MRLQFDICQVTDGSPTSNALNKARGMKDCAWFHMYQRKHKVLVTSGGLTSAAKGAGVSPMAPAFFCSAHPSEESSLELYTSLAPKAAPHPGACRRSVAPTVSITSAPLFLSVAHPHGLDDRRRETRIRKFVCGILHVNF